ncbi:FecR family protein [Pedobacter hiemivivus]|uniref:DUF4974 domain-containing protein n=1 Tax=Pedobacter hiemivivus TaxID=2530454 RepID=A0A4R0NBX6_9SPHI|nr:FecR domain-containing protein [Pedobacter hiemivivus]TCC97819.1 DUF4974 domain-containing protein [Pedobacter hiemivivus]
MKDHHMKVSIDRELLAKYIRRECTVQEKQRVEAFLFQPEWQQALEELLKEDFEAFDHVSYTESENISWNQHFRENYTHKQSGRFFRYSQWMGYAAACLILFAAGFWYFSVNQKTSVVEHQQVVMMEQVNPSGQRSVITLPDSSVVHLGALSSIRYPKKFGSKYREVILKGEAFFDVKPDKRHPFTVLTGVVQTKVLGTSFKINAFKQVMVSVATGKVQVAKLNSEGTTDKPLAILTPGQQVSWNADTNETKLDLVDIDEIREWTKGKVTFANASLAEIVETLERWYNVEISFADEKMARTRLSLIVKAAVPIQHSLDIICSTAHLKYKVAGNKITITHKQINRNMNR